jgi:hypothetical protein
MHCPVAFALFLQYLANSKYLIYCVEIHIKRPEITAMLGSKVRSRYFVFTQTPNSFTKGLFRF